MTSQNPDAASTRAIHLEIEAPGTPEELWETIASGPGIASWFVPAEVDSAAGTLSLTFGPGMVETGTITAWEPPHRFAYTDDSYRHLAYEYTIEARDGGTCIVWLVNSGFGVGDDWDRELESMTSGWKLFLHMLALGRTHFPGQPCSSAIVNAFAAMPSDEVWTTLTEALGLSSAQAEVGARIEASGTDHPLLAGSVVRHTTGMLTILLDQPTTGAAFLIAEPWQDQTVAGLYLYLFGEQAAATLARDEPGWRAWLEKLLPAPAPAAAAPAP